MVEVVSKARSERSCWVVEVAETPDSTVSDAWMMPVQESPAQVVPESVGWAKYQTR